MPKDGDLIVIRPDGKAYYVSANPQNAYEGEAVHVPPHGRLIDADALGSLFQEGQCFFAGNIKYKIENMPTIIPADSDKN